MLSLVPDHKLMLAVSIALHIDLLHGNLSCTRQILQLAVLRDDSYVSNAERKLDSYGGRIKFMTVS